MTTASWFASSFINLHQVNNKEITKDEIYSDFCAESKMHYGYFFIKAPNSIFNTA
jgi:hypothetical protein